MNMYTIGGKHSVHNPNNLCMQYIYTHDDIMREPCD